MRDTAGTAGSAVKKRLFPRLHCSSPSDHYTPPLIDSGSVMAPSTENQGSGVPPLGNRESQRESNIINHHNKAKVLSVLPAG